MMHSDRRSTKGLGTYEVSLARKWLMVGTPARRWQEGSEHLVDFGQGTRMGSVRDPGRTSNRNFLRRAGSVHRVFETAEEHPLSLLQNG